MMRHMTGWISGAVVSTTGFFVTLARTGDMAWAWWLALACGFLVSLFQTWLDQNRALQHAVRIICDERSSRAKDFEISRRDRELMQEQLQAKELTLSEIASERDKLKQSLDDRVGARRRELFSKYRDARKLGDRLGVLQDLIVHLDMTNEELLWLCGKLEDTFGTHPFSFMSQFNLSSFIKPEDWFSILNAANKKGITLSMAEMREFLLFNWDEGTERFAHLTMPPSPTPDTGALPPEPTS